MLYFWRSLGYLASCLSVAESQQVHLHSFPFFHFEALHCVSQCSAVTSALWWAMLRNQIPFLSHCYLEKKYYPETKQTNVDGSMCTHMHIHTDSLSKMLGALQVYKVAGFFFSFFSFFVFFFYFKYLFSWLLTTSVQETVLFSSPLHLLLGDESLFTPV